jgi:hypothetical protein
METVTATIKAAAEGSRRPDPKMAALAHACSAKLTRDCKASIRELKRAAGEDDDDDDDDDDDGIEEDIPLFDAPAAVQCPLSRKTLDKPTRSL